MTPEQAEKFIPLLQAVADGKTLQSLQGDEWKDVQSSITWKGAERYRIKPEPIECDVWISDGEDDEGFPLVCTCSNMDGFPDWRKIRVREITE